MQYKTATTTTRTTWLHDSIDISKLRRRLAVRRYNGVGDHVDDLFYSSFPISDTADTASAGASASGVDASATASASGHGPVFCGRRPRAAAGSTGDDGSVDSASDDDDAGFIDADADAADDDDDDSSSVLTASEASVVVTDDDDDDDEAEVGLCKLEPELKALGFNPWTVKHDKSYLQGLGSYINLCTPTPRR